MVGAGSLKRFGHEAEALCRGKEKKNHLLYVRLATEFLCTFLLEFILGVHRGSCCMEK